MASILVQPHYALDRSLPDLGLWMARSPVVCGLLAAGTLAAGLLAPLALLGGLPAAAIVGSRFLKQIGNAELHGVRASFPYLACYAFWLPWADLAAWIGRRDVSSVDGRHDGSERGRGPSASRSRAAPRRGHRSAPQLLSAAVPKFSPLDVPVPVKIVIES